MLLDKHSIAHTLLAHFDSIPYDHCAVPQERLDLAGKLRSSLLPWRGQFSPELVELLLTEYDTKNIVVLDPFAGSGTTLFEAARKGLECYGAEINPAAFEMASTVHFANVDKVKRREAIEAADRIIKSYLYSVPIESDN